MNRIEKRLREMERRVLGDMPQGQILLDTSQLPMAERQLYEEAARLAGVVNEKTVTNDQSQIMRKAESFLFFHTLKLFHEVLSGHLRLESGDGTRIELMERLMWMINDFPEERKYTDRCVEIDEDPTLDNEGRTKAHAEHDKSLPFKPFSLESWNDFQDNVVLPMARELLLKEKSR